MPHRGHACQSDRQSIGDAVRSHLSGCITAASEQPRHNALQVPHLEQDCVAPYCFQSQQRCLTHLQLAVQSVAFECWQHALQSQHPIFSDTLDQPVPDPRSALLTTSNHHV